MATILCFYEGVMSTGNRPIFDGQLLVTGMSENNRLVMATSGTADRIDHEMKKIRGLSQRVVEIMDKTLDLPPLTLWQRQIEMARSKWTVSMVLASDPAIIEYAVEHGVVGLFFAHPGFSRPAQRPDQSQRGWKALVNELEARL